MLHINITSSNVTAADITNKQYVTYEYAPRQCVQVEALTSGRCTRSDCQETSILGRLLRQHHALVSELDLSVKTIDQLFVIFTKD